MINEPPSDDEVLLERYIKRLLEKADDPNIKPSGLDVIHRYLTQRGLLDKVPNKGTGLGQAVMDQLPFKATDDEPPAPLGLPAGTKLPF